MSGFVDVVWMTVSVVDIETHASTPVLARSVGSVTSDTFVVVDIDTCRTILEPGFRNSNTGCKFILAVVFCTSTQFFQLVVE